MKAKVFFFLILLLIWPIAFAIEQTAPSSSASSQTTVIRIVDDNEGKTSGDDDEKITKEDLKKKETRRKIAERNENENLVLEGEDEESTDETLETIIDGEGIDPETPGMPETALSETGKTKIPEPKRTPVKSEEGGSQASQEGKQGGAGQSGGQQQDSGMNMNTIAQMLPIITQLLGLFKEQPTLQQQQTAQTTPPPPEKPKIPSCS